MSVKLGSEKYTYSNEDNDYASSKYTSGPISRGSGNNSTNVGMHDFMAGSNGNGDGDGGSGGSSGNISGGISSPGTTVSSNQTATIASAALSAAIGSSSSPTTPSPSQQQQQQHHNQHYTQNHQPNKVQQPSPPPPLPPPIPPHHHIQYQNSVLIQPQHQQPAVTSATVSTTPTLYTATNPTTSANMSNHNHHYQHQNNSSTCKGPGCESFNSFEDSSVRNSHSGTTDGGGVVMNAGSVGHSSSRLGNQNLSTSAAVSTLAAKTSSNYMGGSADTISRNQRETLHSRFDFIKVLGKGTYGKVKLANDKRTGKKVAIKIIHKNRIENKQDLARVRREIEFMSRLNHPHVVKILEVYESSEKIILVMEYASGGELYDYLNDRKRVSEVEARGIFRQIVSAVHFLHKNRIVHRDLKLENILIDSNGDIKLADFGLSNNWSPNSLLYTFCGSPLYASPEIVNGFPYFGPEVDCWSLGVLLYTLVYGSMPFQGGDYNRLVKQITDGQFIVPRERSGAFGLIKKCLCTKAAKRASIDDIAEHWWVNVGYAYPPVVFYSYIPGSNKSGGVQALGYEGSPKVSPSIPFGSMSKKTGSSISASQAPVAAAIAQSIGSTPISASTGGGNTASGSSGGGVCSITAPIQSSVY